MRRIVHIHVWIDSDEGPRYLCGVPPEEVAAAVADRRIHEFPMDLFCPDCLRVFANKRLNVQFHVSRDEAPDDDAHALCGVQNPDYLVKGKYADGLDPEDWCPNCKAEWVRQKTP